MRSHKTPIGSESSKSKAIFTYKCTCKGTKTVLPDTPAAAAAPAVKPKKSSIMEWARAYNKAAATAGASVEGAKQVRIECHGMVTVRVEDDKRHPYVPGQQIHVSIHHPKPKPKAQS